MALVLMWTKQQCLAGPDNGGNVDQAEGFNAVRVGQLKGERRDDQIAIKGTGHYW